MAYVQCESALDIVNPNSGPDMETEFSAQAMCIAIYDMDH